jgi:heat shock protein HslJ
MKAAYGFIFFMLFLAGIAFVNLRGMQDAETSRVTAVDQLTDAAWRLSHLGEMVAEPDSEIYIQFRDDGQFGGYTGCNRFFGTVQIGDTFDLGAIGATRRSCPEPANSLEYSFLEALGQTSAAARVDDRLAFRNEAGVSVLRFIATERIEE